MSQELNRNFNALKEKADPPPYYLSYEITEQEYKSVSGTLGTVDSATGGKSRALDQIRCVRDRLPTIGTVPLTSWMPFLAPLAGAA